MKGLSLLVGKLRVDQSKAQTVLTATVILTSLAAMVVGARSMIPLLNSVTFLYRQADTAGMEWIQENIPPTETILVNTFPWGYGLYAGNDGGYWISSLAGPKTMPPPVLYGLTNDPAQIKAINQLSRQVVEKGGQPAELAEVMRQAGLRYVYIGAKGGSFSAKGMLESGLFQTIYHENGTWLLKLQATP